MTGTSIMSEAVAALATAAAVLIEDAHPELLSTSIGPEAHADLLKSLGTDLSALAAAATVLARYDAGKTRRRDIEE